MAITRRDFIRAGAGALATGTLAARALAAGQSTAKAARALVIIELNGGNDGLNTVIPYTDPAYYQARPTLAISPSQVFKLSGEVGLHPSMPEMADLFHNGRLAIFQGIGHPNPSRSHFTSQQVWHTADPSGAGSAGWLANRANTFYCGPVCPQMFCGGSTVPFCLDATGHAELIRCPDIPATPGQDPQSRRPRTPNVSYPTTPLARGLSKFAQVIAQTDAPAFFHITQAGFDTHARQADLHANLLKTVSQAIGAFIADLSADGRAGDTMVMVFSEFGRCLKENTSAGTDHGEASVVLFAGGGIPSGIHGANPSLENLHDGGLRFTTDFRGCHATAMGRMVCSEFTL